jgi:hypothetical protein
MDREMQLRLYEPYINPARNIRLSEFPVDETLVNPGIGVQMYDFMVDLHGKEDYELKKKTDLLPASLPEKNNLVEKNSQALNNDIKQEGFGNKDYVTKSSEKFEKPTKLDSSILQAMTHATIKTEKLTYVPNFKRKNSEQKGKGPCNKKALKDNFKLV